MADSVEVAIEAALLDNLKVFATGQSPQIDVSYPDIEFTPPAVSQTAKWLRATFLPIEAGPQGVAFDSTNQHSGIFQVDVFYGQGAGELKPRRLAELVATAFARGTQLTREGFTVTVMNRPTPGTLINDGAWNMIPVRVRYQSFA